MNIKNIVLGEGTLSLKIKLSQIIDNYPIYDWKTYNKIKTNLLCVRMQECQQELINHLNYLTKVTEDVAIWNGGHFSLHAF